MKNVKILRSKIDWVSCNEMFVSTDNCVQNIFEKFEKSSKVEQDQKNLMSAFA